MALGATPSSKGLFISFGVKGQVKERTNKREREKEHTPGSLVFKNQPGSLFIKLKILRHLMRWTLYQ